MSHELQSTNRSLLLEGKARLNTIKHPNQLSHASAVQQLPHHEVSHSVHYTPKEERASARQAH
jgi:hypothetical protein